MTVSDQHPNNLLFRNRGRRAFDRIINSFRISCSSSKNYCTIIKKNNLSKIPVIVGGIIPPVDEKKLISIGVKAVFTPKDFKIEDIMKNLVSIVRRSYG